MRPTGSAEELERRRRLAVERVRQGERPAVVARVLGVNRNSLYRWRRMAERGLAAQPQPGRTRRLSDEQLRHLEALLRPGAEAHGWPNGLWTAARVGQVIHKHFGVEYHPAHVGRILKEHLNWTCQRPVCQHTDRDDDEIQRWVRDDFPSILREAAERKAYLVFIDETGFMLEPTVRRTYAPCGKTPVLKLAEPHGRISVIGAITVSPVRRRARLAYHLLVSNANFRGPSVVQFVRDLHERLAAPMTVVWDRILIHSCDSVKQCLDSAPGVATEYFPAYAPELNPVDQVWGHVKHNRLTNYTPPDLGVLRCAVTAELERLRQREDLLKSFIRFTKLPVAL
jgi:transposase